MLRETSGRSATLPEQLAASVRRLGKRIDALAALRVERQSLAGDEAAAARRRYLDVQIRAAEVDDLPGQLAALKTAIARAREAEHG